VLSAVRMLAIFLCLLRHLLDLFVNALYSPMTWPDFARQLAAAMGPAGNGTELLAGLQEGIVGETYSDLARFAVICADAPRNSQLTPEDYARATIAALGVSRFASGLIFTDVRRTPTAERLGG
jgi:hypothetical protein